MDEPTTKLEPLGIRICTCLMSEGITWESEDHFHNSWCDGLTDHRWIPYDLAMSLIKGITLDFIDSLATRSEK